MSTSSDPWGILAGMKKETHREPQNLEEAAYREIMGLILDHCFKPGDTLLETELTERLNMRSRTPVRHALTQLVAKGFLEKKKKKGYYIPYPSKEDARHVFFARERIESINAESAALNRSDEDLQTTRTLIENEAETGRAGRKNVYSAINESFHLMIAKMSSNPYLEQYSRHLFWRSSFYIFYFGSYYTEKDYINYMLAPPEHQAILDAIETRDAARARSLMHDHVHYTSEKVISKITF